MLPSLSTAMVMFSGLVCVGMLTAFGSVTGTVLVITGIVIRKMMSSTSITSTSGVVLMLAIAPPSSPPTCIAIVRSSRAAFQGRAGVPQGTPAAPERLRLLVGRCLRRSRPYAADRSGGIHARTTHQVSVQVAREITQRVLQYLVAAEQPVVAHDCGHRHEQPDGGHDERLTDGAGHLVDARLARDTDADERVQDAPHGAEQPHERGSRTDGREESEAVVEPAVHAIDRALQRHGDPLVEIDAVGEAAVMMRSGTQTVLCHRPEVIALLQALDSVLDRRRGPELLLDDARGLLELTLVPQLGEHDVPGSERHDEQQDQHGTRDDVPARPQGGQTVRI